MSDALNNPRHEALCRYLRSTRRQLDLSQDEVARRMRRSPSWVSDVERGQHRVTVVEFLDFAAALEFDPLSALRRIIRVGRD